MGRRNCYNIHLQRSQNNVTPRFGREGLFNWLSHVTGIVGLSNGMEVQTLCGWGLEGYLVRYRCRYSLILSRVQTKS